MVLKLKLEILIFREKHWNSIYRSAELFNLLRPTAQTLNKYFCSLISTYKQSSFLHKSLKDSTCKQFRHEESPILWRDSINKWTVFVLSTRPYLLFCTVARKTFPCSCYWKGYAIFDLQTFALCLHVVFKALHCN